MGTSIRICHTARPNPGIQGRLRIYRLPFASVGLHLDEGVKARNLGWLYWLPNPLLPFIWFHVAVSLGHPELSFQESISSS